MKLAVCFLSFFLLASDTLPAEAGQVGFQEQKERTPDHRFLFSIGSLISGYPSWENRGYSVDLNLSYSFFHFLEIGGGFGVFKERRIDTETSLNTYASLPMSIWGRLRLGRHFLRGTLETGFTLNFTRVEAAMLHEGRWEQVERVDPAVFVRMGLLIWTPLEIGFHLGVGSSYFLKKPEISTTISDHEVVLLNLQKTSFDISARIILPLN